MQALHYTNEDIENIIDPPHGKICKPFIIRM